MSTIYYFWGGLRIKMSEKKLQLGERDACNYKDMTNTQWTFRTDDIIMNLMKQSFATIVPFTRDLPIPVQQIN